VSDSDSVATDCFSAPCPSSSWCYAYSSRSDRLFRRWRTDPPTHPPIYSAPTPCVGTQSLLPSCSLFSSSLVESMLRPNTPSQSLHERSRADRCTFSHLPINTSKTQIKSQRRSLDTAQRFSHLTAPPYRHHRNSNYHRCCRRRRRHRRHPSHRSPAHLCACARARARATRACLLLASPPDADAAAAAAAVVPRRNLKRQPNLPFSPSIIHSYTSTPSKRLLPLAPPDTSHFPSHHPPLPTAHAAVRCICFFFVPPGEHAHFLAPTFGPSRLPFDIRLDPHPLSLVHPR
jgi:hypothetical protein